MNVNPQASSAAADGSGIAERTVTPGYGPYDGLSSIGVTIGAQTFSQSFGYSPSTGLMSTAGHSSTAGSHSVNYTYSYDNIATG